MLKLNLYFMGHMPWQDIVGMPSHLMAADLPGWHKRCDIMLTGVRLRPQTCRACTSPNVGQDMLKGGGGGGGRGGGGGGAGQIMWTDIKLCKNAK